MSNNTELSNCQSQHTNNSDPNEIDWIAKELEELSLTNTTVSCLARVNSDPIFDDDAYSKQIASLKTTIQKQTEENKRITNEAMQYAKYCGLLAKELQVSESKYMRQIEQHAQVVAKYKSQITYQNAKIYKLKKKLANCKPAYNSQQDPYVWN